MTLAAPPRLMMVTIRCSGTQKNNPTRLCGNVLIKINAELWESRILAGRQEIECDKCGTKEDFSKWT